MRRELKKDLVKDIMELKGWCLNNNKSLGFIRVLNRNGQQYYLSETLLVRTLMNKSKLILDTIREQLLEEVVY